MANSLPVVSRCTDRLGAGARTAADLEDVVSRLRIHEVDRPQEARGDLLHCHGLSLPDSAGSVTDSGPVSLGGSSPGGWAGPWAVPDAAARLGPVTVTVGVLGARGRVGAQVCRALEAADDLELVAAVDAGDPRAALSAAEVVVDFTHPDVVMDNLRWCVGQGLHCVVGTTGFDEARLDAVRSALADAPGVGYWWPPTSRSAPC